MSANTVKPPARGAGSSANGAFTFANLTIIPDRDELAVTALSIKQQRASLINGFLQAWA
jgi:hypothetical protein